MKTISKNAAQDKTVLQGLPLRHCNNVSQQITEIRTFHSKLWLPLIFIAVLGVLGLIMESNPERFGGVIQQPGRAVSFGLLALAGIIMMVLAFCCIRKKVSARKS